MSGDLILAVDLGTTGLKVGLVDRRGANVATRLHTVGTQRIGDAATQDPEEWWRLIATSTRELTDAYGSERVAAVTVTGQFASVVPVDESGVAVAPCVLWSDSRGGPHVRRVVGGPVLGYNPRHLPRLLSRTGGAPSLSGTDALGGYLYVIHDQPDVARRARWFLEPVDFLTTRFGAAPSTTGSTMLTWWIVDNRDPSQARYDVALARRFGVDLDRLATLRPPLSVIGAVDARGAASTGLRPGTPIVAGMTDLHAAALGTGTTTTRSPAHLALSTTSWISTTVSAKRTDALHSIATTPGPDGRSFLAIDNQETGAKSLEWFASCIASAPIDYEALSASAARATAGSDRVIFTPWLAGERSPIDNHDARAGWHNVSLATGAAELTRSVFEGVAMNSRWLLAYVEKFARRSFESIRVLGGGANSDVWCQIYADVLDRPVERMQSPTITQLRGCATGAWIALGEMTIDEVPDAVVTSDRFTPDPANRATYDALFREFRDLMSSQRRMFTRLQRLPSP